MKSKSSSNSKDLKENKELRWPVKKVSESKLKNRSNMNYMLLKERRD